MWRAVGITGIGAALGCTAVTTALALSNGELTRHQVHCASDRTRQVEIRLFGEIGDSRNQAQGRVEVYSVASVLSPTLLASVTPGSFTFGHACRRVAAWAQRWGGGPASARAASGRVRCRLTRPLDIQVRTLRYPGSGRVHAQDVYLMVGHSRTILWAQARYAGYLSFDTRYCRAG